MRPRSSCLLGLCLTPGLQGCCPTLFLNLGPALGFNPRTISLCPSLGIDLGLTPGLQFSPPAGFLHLLASENLPSRVLGLLTCHRLALRLLGLLTGESPLPGVGLCLLLGQGPTLRLCSLLTGKVCPPGLCLLSLRKSPALDLLGFLAGKSLLTFDLGTSGL